MRYVPAIVFTAALVLVSCGRPPERPLVTGSDTAFKNTRADVTVRASDPDGHDVSYLVSWGDGQLEDWSDPLPSGVALSFSHVFRGQGRLLVMAKARDVDGKESPWSLPHYLLVRPRPPTVSQPTGPNAASREKFCSFSAVATDSDSDEVRVRFDWGDGTVSNWSELVSSGTTVQDSHAFADTGVFEVRARAVDATGDTSDWSAAHSVEVVAGWMTVAGENFEGSFPRAGWTLAGETTWAKETYRHYEGSAAAWCVGSALTPPGYYPNYVRAVMTYGPFSLADADSALLIFHRWLDSESWCDYFCWQASINGTDFAGDSISGSYPFWQCETLNLRRVPFLGNLCGRPRVWVRFVFKSDFSVTAEGAWLDNISIVKYVGGGAR